MDTMTEKTLKICLVIISLLLIWSTVLLGKKTEQNKEQEISIKKLQNQVDSLSAELFPAQVELNRFRIAYEIFVSRNPKAAEQYGTIISDETE